MDRVDRILRSLLTSIDYEQGGEKMTELEVADEVSQMLKLSPPDRETVILMAQRLAREAQQRGVRRPDDLPRSDPS